MEGMFSSSQSNTSKGSIYLRTDRAFKMKISRTASRLALNTISRTLLQSSSSSRVARTCRLLSSSAILNSDQNVVRSKIADLSIPDLNVFDYIWKDAVSKHGDKVAMVNASTGQELTYSECESLSLRIAHGLKSVLGLNRGDVLALLLPNCPEYVLLFTGAAAVAVTVTTINNVYTAPEVARQLVMSGAKAVVTLEEYLPKVKEAFEKLPADRPRLPVVILNPAPSFPGQSLIPYSSLTRCNPLKRNDMHLADLKDTVALMPYSSGTTGLAKGVMITHHNLVANGWQLIYAKELEWIKPVTDTFQCVTVGVLPLFHIYGMHVTALTTLHAGGKMVILPGFEPQAFTKALHTYKPTFLHLVPPLLDFCARHPSITPELMAPVEGVMVGAAPVGPALSKSFKKKSPHTTVREGWGMSECLVCTVTGLKDEVIGSCGTLAPNTQMKIVDLTTGDSLGPNKNGELCVKGPQVMKGYLDNEKATRETIDDDGWLHSGDIGYYDKDGHFFIVDRLKELIKVKGLQVGPPAELEDLLRTHPLVADVAVIGVPHERLGNAPRAYVVPKDKADLTEDTVHKFVNAEVAEFKRLVGGIEFVEAIPKSATGKILRRVLMDQYNNEHKK